MGRFDHQLADVENDLSYCDVCGGAEGSLPTLCPGRRLTPEESDAIYAGELNFTHGPMSGAGWWIPHPTKKEGC
jgi:hypothetical protein